LTHNATERFEFGAPTVTQQNN